MKSLTVEEAIELLKKIPSPKKTRLFVFSDSANRYENINTIDVDDEGDAVIYIS